MLLRRSGDFVIIMYNALPDSNYSIIDDIESDDIPDVRLNKTDVYSSRIYAFYCAGIMLSPDSSGSFYPDSYLTRGEATAIGMHLIVPKMGTFTSDQLVIQGCCRV